jgi:hypothetical protein
MQPQKCEIVYTDSALAAKYGVKPITVGVGLAEEYEKKGIAKIINKRPNANPSLPPLTHEPLRSVMPEETLKNHITWVSGIYPDTHLRKIGERLGFAMEVQSPTLFSLSRMLQSELILVEYPLKSFSYNQISQLSGVLLQKRIPFMLRIVSVVRDTNLAKFLPYAKIIFFKKSTYLDDTIENYGPTFDNYFVEPKDEDPYVFWKEINRIVNPIPHKFEEIESKMSSESIIRSDNIHEKLKEKIKPKKIKIPTRGRPRKK